MIIQGAASSVKIVRLSGFFYSSLILTGFPQCGQIAVAIFSPSSSAKNSDIEQPITFAISLSLEVVGLEDIDWLNALWEHSRLSATCDIVKPCFLITCFIFILSNKFSTAKIVLILLLYKSKSIKKEQK
nr:MAG TPA: hypothetical protein [Caudoviricetes sp.]